MQRPAAMLHITSRRQQRTKLHQEKQQEEHPKTWKTEMECWEKTNTNSADEPMTLSGMQSFRKTSKSDYASSFTTLSIKNYTMT